MSTTKSNIEIIANDILTSLVEYTEAHYGKANDDEDIKLYAAKIVAEFAKKGMPLAYDEETRTLVAGQ